MVMLFGFVMSKYHIYCDESGIVNEKYMVLGGVLIPSNKISDIDNAITQIRGVEFINHEIKFEKLKSYKNLKFYQSIIDVVAEFNLHYRCVIFDTAQINHKQYNNTLANNINEQGFHKQYFTLLNTQFIATNNTNYYIVYLDERPSHSMTKVNVDTLICCLNAKDIVNPPVKSLRYMNSKKSNFIQIADLLTGSVNFEKNPKNHSKSYKPLFVEYLRNKVNIRDISKNTPYGRLDWKVFNCDYTKSKRYKG